MNLKTIFNAKKSFLYIYILIILINLVVIYFLYNFIDKYAYNSIIFENNLTARSDKLSDDININKFNKVIENIEKKSIHKNF